MVCKINDKEGKSKNLKKNIDQDIFDNPVIKEALDLGFEYNDIIEAWTYFPDDKVHRCLHRRDERNRCNLLHRRHRRAQQPPASQGL